MQVNYLPYYAAARLRERRPQIVYWRKRFWEWTQTHYKVVDTETLEDSLRFIIYQFYDGKAINISLFGVIQEALRELRRKCRLADEIPMPSWVREHIGRSALDLIPVRNGIVNVATQTLEPHSPTFFNGYVLPYEFDRDAQCPRFLQFLNEVTLAQPAFQKSIQQWFGYCLTTDTHLQTFVALEGEGGNGKGALTRLLQKMIGQENFQSVGLNMMNDKFQRALLYNQLANFSSEASQVSRTAENYLKLISGEDPDVIEDKNAKGFKIPKHTARLILSFNERPQFTDKTGGLWRRMLLWSFRYAVPTADPSLEPDMECELPGVLNWALAGLASLRTNGAFTHPEGSLDEIQAYRVQADPNREFVDEYLEADPTNNVLVRDNLYPIYLDWAKGQVDKPLTKGGLGALIKRAFPEVDNKVQVRVEGKQKRGYRGVRLRVDVGNASEYDTKYHM